MIAHMTWVSAGAGYFLGVFLLHYTCWGNLLACIYHWQGLVVSSICDAISSVRVSWEPPLFPVICSMGDVPLVLSREDTLYSSIDQVDGPMTQHWPTHVLSWLWTECIECELWHLCRWGTHPISGVKKHREIVFQAADYNSMALHMEYDGVGADNFQWQIKYLYCSLLVAQSYPPSVKGHSWSHCKFRT